MDLPLFKMIFGAICKNQLRSSRERGAVGAEPAPEQLERSQLRSRLRWFGVAEVPKLSGAARSRFLIKHNEHRSSTYVFIQQAKQLKNVYERSE